MRPELDLLLQLRSLGISLEPCGEQLRVRGPRELLTPELLEELRARKQELLALLRLEAEQPPVPLAPCSACGGRTWWLAPGLGAWLCATCRPPAVPEEATQVLLPLRDLRSSLEEACRQLARASGFPRLQLEFHRAVAPGSSPWTAFLRSASVPDLRLATARLRELLGLEEDAHAPQRA